MPCDRLHFIQRRVTLRPNPGNGEVARKPGGRRGWVRHRRDRMPVKPKYLHVGRSRGMLEADVGGEQLVARGWWTATRDGSSVVIFSRLGVYPSSFLYAAIHWDSRALIGTAFNRTNELAEDALLKDMYRRGWFL